MTKSKFLAIVAVAGMIFASTPAVADQANTDQELNIAVNSSLSITALQGRESIVIQGFQAGDFGFKTLAYDIRSNNVSLAAVSNAFRARVNRTLPKIRLSVKDVAIRNDQTPGDPYAIIDPVASPPTGITLGTTDVVIGTKPVSSGPNGRLWALRAFVPVFATATETVTPADGGLVTMVLTVQDA